MRSILRKIPVMSHQPTFVLIKFVQESQGPRMNHYEALLTMRSVFLFLPTLMISEGFHSSR